MATAEEKQDAAHATYKLAKDRALALADIRGHSGIPFIVEHGDTEFRSAIDADVSAQKALSAALRAVDD